MSERIVADDGHEGHWYTGEEQREELAAIKNPLGRLKGAFMDNIDGGTEVERIEGSSKVRAGSSITDELREYAEKNECKSYCKLLTAIADRIDAEHAKAVERARMDGMDATFGNGWGQLPVDADGVPIRVGGRADERHRPASEGEIHARAR